VAETRPSTREAGLRDASSSLARLWQTPGGLSRSEALLAIVLASTSGLGILVHTFGPVPMSFSAPFVVFPTACLLAGAILVRRQLPERFHAFARALVAGASWGMVATLFYDGIRPLLGFLFGFTFNPYRAIFIFGELITGLPRSDPFAVAAGWTYHFWNGTSFGMMFALFRPQGGILPGVLWAETLQVLMMIAYPSFLNARLDDPGFMATGIIGHGLWGIVLGAGLKRTWARQAG